MAPAKLTPFERLSERAREAGLFESSGCLVGHSYALRTMPLLEPGKLAVFTVLEQEGTSCVLAWHLLSDR